ncbi:MAG: hypothetical protein QXO74_04685 [Candidatus Methanomethylicia archaeon]
MFISMNPSFMYSNIVVPPQFFELSKPRSIQSFSYNFMGDIIVIFPITS